MYKTKEEACAEARKRIDASQAAHVIDAFDFFCLAIGAPVGCLEITR